MFGMGKYADRFRMDVQNFLVPKAQQPTVPKREDLRRTMQPTRTPQKPEPVAATMSASTPAPLKDTNKSTIRQSTFNLESLLINGKPLAQCPKNKVTIRGHRLIIELSDTAEVQKFRFEVKSEDGKIEVAPDGTIVISAKKVEESKNLINKKGPPQWVTNTSLTNNKDPNIFTITLQCDAATRIATLRNFLEKCKEDEFQVLKQEGVIAEEDKPKTDAPMPSKDDNIEAQKIRKNLSQLKQQDKISILTDVFKIKKQFDYPGISPLEKLRCPISTCQKNYQQPSQLRTHMKKHHPELNKLQIELTDDGVFKYGQKALDFALIMGKLYPLEVKNVVKVMKQKNTYDA